MTKTEDKRVFIDTNVLLAATDTDRTHHFDARAFLDDGVDVARVMERNAT